MAMSRRSRRSISCVSDTFLPVSAKISVFLVIFVRILADRYDFC